MGLLHVKDLGYNTESKTILKQIDLSFKKGTFYGILGPNGSGKTTLLDLLLGLLPRTSGEVFIEGQELKSYSRKQIAQKIALVPQHFDITFAYRVQEILEMGRYPFKKRMQGLDESDYRLIDAIKELFALSCFENKDVSSLSGGEKQRVAFAKALVQDTPILFLDESTSNMDPYFAHFVLKEVRRKTQEESKTVVSVFHDMNLASLYCDEVILLKDGGVMEMGKTADILTPMNIKRLFGIESIAVYENDKNYIIPV